MIHQYKLTTNGVLVDDDVIQWANRECSNVVLSLDTYKETLAPFLEQVYTVKKALQESGYSLCGREPLKITIAAKHYGYIGTALAEILIRQGLVPEFADSDYMVLMLTPETGREGLERLETVLKQIPRKEKLEDHAPTFRPAVQTMSIREAMLSCSEVVPVAESLGRILAVPTVGCPPAVPIVACGERIDSHAIECFDYYGIRECCVVKEDEGDRLWILVNSALDFFAFLMWSPMIRRM